MTTTPTTPRKKKIRLGELLLRENVITELQLQDALQRQKQTGKKLGRALTDVGAITEKELHEFLARHLEIDYIDLANLNLQHTTVRLLPEAHARRYRALVLQADHNEALIGMADPTDIFAYDAISRSLHRPLRIGLVKESDLLRTIDMMYRRTDEIEALAAEVRDDLSTDDVNIDSLLVDEGAADAPVIKLLQTMFRDALQVGASDIHIEPEESVLRIRQRVDGVLQEQTLEGKGVAGAVVTRLKLMSGLDISEKRLPQDGRFTVRVGDASVDVRVSTMPIQHGESVVLRLLDQSTNLIGLEELGMPTSILEKFERLIERPSGLILVTGPTGSGKTTTLYSALKRVNRAGTKIITVEDPVEYRLERINQVQVNSKIGLNFARVLRTALRQDPDVILVGEMRDNETVEIGLRAAMTGHLVFSTLHTVSAPATLERLLDMGAAPYLVAASLQAIVAQRLIRRVCESCAQTATPTPGQRAWLYGMLGDERARHLQFVEGRGCNYCHLTGYRGRIGVYELLEMNSSMTDAIRCNDISRFNHLADENINYRPLSLAALDYATEGRTTLAEVMRVAGGADALADEQVASEVCSTSEPVASISGIEPSDTAVLAAVPE
ncbi:MAG: type II/IV secretion system protein [Gammaproteobacteria bacterium]|nr:type II/IV secretion system protein [Gammaproteobacteria bacterium]